MTHQKNSFAWSWEGKEANTRGLTKNRVQKKQVPLGFVFGKARFGSKVAVTVPVYHLIPRALAGCVLLRNVGIFTIIPAVPPISHTNEKLLQWDKHKRALTVMCNLEMRSMRKSRFYTKDPNYGSIAGSWLPNWSVNIYFTCTTLCQWWQVNILSTVSTRHPCLFLVLGIRCHVSLESICLHVSPDGECMR